MFRLHIFHRLHSSCIVTVLFPFHVSAFWTYFVNIFFISLIRQIYSMAFTIRIRTNSYAYAVGLLLHLLQLWADCIKRFRYFDLFLFIHTHATVSLSLLTIFARSFPWHLRRFFFIICLCTIINDQNYSRNLSSNNINFTQNIYNDRTFI